MRPSHISLLALAAALLASCATPPAERPPIRLTILHTNDHHGRFWPNSNGEYGMAARKTLIDRIRAEVKAAGGHVLLLDGGDINTGVPESDLQDAEPDFKGMNLLGYDASAVGNHEFDKPGGVLAKQRGWAQFPMLAANIYDRKTGQRMFPPYQVFERGGYRIAVLGLTTDDTAKLSLPENVQQLEFRKPADEAAALLPELRRQADVVIAATHMGHYPDGKRGINAPGDVEMARSTTGLDLIVGGHSQNPVCMLAENQRNEAYVPGQPCAPDRQNGTWIVQAHEWGKYVGRADFEVRPGKIELLRYQLLPVNLKQRLADGTRRNYTETIPEDETLKAFLKPFQDFGQSKLGIEIGSVDAELDGKNVRLRPTNLGTLIARTMLDRTGADMALMNSGGVRDSLQPGRITMRDVLTVQPFGNLVCVVRLSGAELLSYLQAAARMTPNSGALPQTAGVRMIIVNNQLESATLGGQPIDPKRDYRLAINSFTASGGDGYPKLNSHPGFINTGFTDADVLRDFITRHSPLKAANFEPGDAVQRR